MNQRSDKTKHDPKEVVVLLNNPDSVGRALPLCIAAECIEQLRRELAAEREQADMNYDHCKRAESALSSTAQPCEHDWSKPHGFVTRRCKRCLLIEPSAPTSAATPDCLAGVTLKNKDTSSPAFLMAQAAASTSRHSR